MQDLNDKITGNTLSAAEWNEVPSEIQNVIEGLGIVLSGADLNQLGKAIAGYVANGNFYTDSGVADAYVLTTVGSKQSLTAYTDGAAFEFITSNVNTGASTVNVAGLGVKDIKLINGADPSAGDITGRVSLKFDNANDRCELQLPEGSTTHEQWATISNGTDADHDIDFNPGRMPNSDGIIPIILSSILVKQLDAAWAAGTAMGGLFTGSIAANTTYHCFVIVKDSDGSVDAGFDTSVTAANIPTGYTAFRRVGSIVTTASSNIRNFLQLGDYFKLLTPVLDVSVLNFGSAAVVTGLTVPSGIEVNADLYVEVADLSPAGTVSYNIQSIAQPDVPAALPDRILRTQVNAESGVTHLQMPTDVSGNIRYRASTTAADIGINIVTKGWYDERVV